MMDVRHQKYFSKALIPGALSLSLIFLSMVNLHLSGFGNFVPLVAAMSIFYWVLYWPVLMPIWFIFFMGIFQDILYAAPMGVSSLMNLLFWWAVISQRKYLIKETFLAMWVVFAVDILVFCIISSIVYSFYFKEFLFSGMVIMQCVFTVLLYPLFHKLFDFVHINFLEK